MAQRDKDLSVDGETPAGARSCHPLWRGDFLLSIIVGTSGTSTSIRKTVTRALFHLLPGHRAHTVYVGVHLPGERRHRRHHKHHHSQRHSYTADNEDADNDRPSKFLLCYRLCISLFPSRLLPRHPQPFPASQPLTLPYRLSTTFSQKSLKFSRPQLSTPLYRLLNCKIPPWRIKACLLFAKRFIRLTYPARESQFNLL